MKQENKQNMSLNLLKMFMCFEVVLSHFWNPTSIPAYLYPFYLLKNTAVPVFILLSFYFSKNLFISQNKEKLKRRLKRLIVPHIIWSLIYFLLFSLVIKVSFGDLLWQIFTGHSSKLNPTMWFQIDLIILTILFFVIFYFYPKDHLLILLTILLITYLLHWSGINYSFFNQFPYEIKYPFGRLAEMIPFAVIGFYFAYFNLIDYLKKHMKLILVGGGILNIFLIMFNKNIQILGFGYSDFYLLFLAVYLFIIFNCINLKRYNFVNYIVKNFSKYTFGVYCMHRLIGNGLLYFFTFINFPKYTFLDCLIIYILCFLVSYTFSKLPFKFFKNIVE